MGADGYNGRMSWASRRRTIYLTGVVLFFTVVIGGPLAYLLLRIPPTCHDGLLNHGETAPDRGGPCLLLDEARLSPSAIVWARTFRVRQPDVSTSSPSGAMYSAVAYVENPNAAAGVLEAPYRFLIYDSENVLVAEREGVAFVSPGGITPFFAGGIDTGNRAALRAIFTFTAPLTWVKASRTTDGLTVSNIRTINLNEAPRIQATVANASPAPILDTDFVAVIFDRGDNAFAVSATKLDRIESGGSAEIVFSWPDPFGSPIGKIEILPVRHPEPDKKAER